MKFFYFFPLCLLSSCAPLAQSTLKIEIDQEFDSFYKNFLEEGLKHGIDHSKTSVTINFVDEIKNSETGNTVLGRCFFSTNLIEINKTQWVKLSDSKKTSLIFHELGHCVLNRDHDNSEIFGQKTSMMHYIILSDKEYQGREKYFSKELFTFKKDFDLFNQPEFSKLKHNQGEYEECQ